MTARQVRRKRSVSFCVKKARQANAACRVFYQKGSMFFRRIISLTIVSFLSLFIVTNVSAHGGIPRLEISAERLSPGEPLQVRGVDFEYDQEATIALIGNQVEITMATVVADAEGVFIQNLILPTDLAAGSYAVRARTYDHVVISPLITVYGTPIMESEDTAFREQSDVQLGPVPTFPPGVATTAAISPASTEPPMQPATCRNLNPAILAAVLLLAVIGVVGTRLWRRRMKE